MLSKHLEDWGMSVLLKELILRATDTSILISISWSKDSELGDGNFNIWMRQTENKLIPPFSSFLNGAYVWSS